MFSSVVGRSLLAVLHSTLGYHKEPKGSGRLLLEFPGVVFLPEPIIREPTFFKILITPPRLRAVERRR
jgi:hypothetical protein